jgi:hypothetical protein
VRAAYLCFPAAPETDGRSSKTYARIGIQIGHATFYCATSAADRSGGAAAIGETILHRKGGLSASPAICYSACERWNWIGQR